MARKNFIRNKNAFTLVEIVMVLILIGILGIIGVVGLNSAASSDRAIYERQLESSIRYAQQYSMSHYCFTFVVFTNPPANPTSNTPSNSNTCSISSSGRSSGAEYGGYQICACPSSNTSNSGINSSVPIVPILINNPLAQTANYFSVALNYGITYSVQNNDSVTPSVNGNYFAFNSEGQPGIFARATATGANLICLSNPAQPSFMPFSIAAQNYSAKNYFLQISFGYIPSDSFYIYPNTGLVSSSGSL
ncbi:MAG: prepilin-type N-terminal cleavage/methylation domain-containing protein [bacterium]